MKKTTRDNMLRAAYEEMHCLTHGACETCPNEAAKRPYRCCDPIACENARKWAGLKGVTPKETGHPTLLFMGPDGCMLALDLKPLCTMHVCPECPLHSDPRYLVLCREIERLEGEAWTRYMEMLNGTIS